MSQFLALGRSAPRGRRVRRNRQRSRRRVSLARWRAALDICLAVALHATEHRTQLFAEGSVAREHLVVLILKVVDAPVLGFEFGNAGVQAPLLVAEAGGLRLELGNTAVHRS